MSLEETEGESSKGYTEPKREYNIRSIRNVALTSLRYGIGAHLTAALTTAAWIDAWVISKDNTHLAVDHSKVVRAQENVMKELEKEIDLIASSGKIECIFFDGRKDLTRTLLEIEGSTQKYPGMVKEEHYSVCMEPGGNYLFHFSPEEATETVKSAEVVANNLIDLMAERGVAKSLKAIGGDSTNINTGWAGGVMQWVEKKVGRNLVWIVCMLHTN